uniref:F-box domain-containing protein n=1 Tax=Strongyloides venezuelensis TaxID=75913 RepID=A0A0K0FGD3_STRVS
MDSDSDEKGTEEESNIFVLSDALLVRILAELSWKDILNVKLVSRSFYNFIHENYHQLTRRNVHIVQTFYWEKDLFNFRIMSGRVIEEDSRVNPPFDYDKYIEKQSDEEVSRIFKMFDMRTLDTFNIPFVDDLDTFGIFNRYFQKGTNIGDLRITKLSEKNFTNFRMFLDKISSIKKLEIEHMCFPLTETKDVYSLLPISSLGTIETFVIFECPETRILSADIVTNFFRDNPNMKCLEVGSMNIEFLRSVFKEYFTMDQTRRMDGKCDFRKISLNLYCGGEFEHLRDILRNDLNKLKNVEEVYERMFPYEHVIFGSVIDCKYCHNDMHVIVKYVALWDDRLCDRKWKYHHADYNDSP